MEPQSIVIAGADGDGARSLAAVVVAAGHHAESGLEDAASVLRHIPRASVLVVDAASFVHDDVARMVDECAKAASPLPCLVALRDPSVEETVAWMRRGAYAVIPLPPRRDSFGGQIEQALRHRELALRNAELERSLEAHERLAMIGKLAAGVAHELNNPLDGVLRYVNMAVEKLPKEAPQVTYLHEARRGLRRMADIVRDLLQFSRNAAAESADEDAERLARDAVEQVVAAAANRAVVEAAFNFPVSGLHLPRGMFQVFGNLARNAVDAMPNGGTLRVAATVADGRVRIEFRDSGTGIPEEIRERIFEPFFTTKEVGKGTGLGLPICQRIVERLGGRLSLESEVGRGTTVSLDLPVRRAAPAAQRAQARVPVKSVSEGVF